MIEAVTAPPRFDMFVEWAQSTNMELAIEYLGKFIESHEKERDKAVEAGDFHRATLVAGKVLGLRLAIDRLLACRLVSK